MADQGNSRFYGLGKLSRFGHLPSSELTSQTDVFHPLVCDEGKPAP